MSNISSLSSNILLRNWDNNSWAKINTDGITDSENHFEETFTEDFYSFISGGSLTVKVNTSATDTPHKISIDTLNITIEFTNEYNSSSNRISWALWCCRIPRMVDGWSAT